jgi:hypothetical protein
MLLTERANIIGLMNALASDLRTSLDPLAGALAHLQFGWPQQNPSARSITRPPSRMRKINVDKLFVSP